MKQKNILRYVFCIVVMLSSHVLFTDNFYDAVSKGVIVSSAANARGAQNIDCSNTETDQVEVLSPLATSISDALVANACDPTCITQSMVSTGTFTITAAGRYILTEHISAASGTVITINGNDIELDLCGFSISGSNTADAISILANASTITIHNGVIRNVEDGITIPAGAEHVLLADMIFTQVHGFVLNTLLVSDLRFIHATIYECARDVGDTANDLILIVNTTELQFSNLKIYENGNLDHNPGTPYRIIRFFNVRNGILNDIFLNENLADCLDVIAIQQSKNISFKEIEGNRNSSNTDFFNGITIFDSDFIHCENMVFAQSTSVLNTGEITDFQATGNNAEHIIFSKCKSSDCGINAAYASTIEAFRAVNNASYVTFDECTALGSLGRGFARYEGSTAIKFLKCVAISCIDEGFRTEAGLTSGLVYYECSSQNNGYGYSVNGTLNQAEFKFCQALSNTNDGFDLNNQNVLFLGNNSCFNGTNYTNVSNITGVITSPANARGWDNIDCSNTETNQYTSKIDAVSSTLATYNCSPISITQSQVSGGTYTISTPGIYRLLEDLSLAGAGTVITIDSDDVELNLCGFKISGASARGINILSSHKNITIHNGVLSNLSNSSAILTGNDERDITMRDLIIHDIANNAINCVGTSLNPNDRIVIERVTVRDSGNSAQIATITAIKLTECRNSIIDDCMVHNCGNSTDTAIIINIDNCDCCFIKDTIVNVNQANTTLKGIQVGSSTCTKLEDIYIMGNNGRVAGISVSASSDTVIKNAFITGNTGPSGQQIRGIEFLSACSYSILERVEVMGNTSVSADMDGIYADNTSLGRDVIRDCIVMNNAATTSGTVYGYHFLQTTNYTYFKNCIASNNIRTSGTSYGFFIVLSTGTVIDSCKSWNHDSNTSSAGFYFTQSAAPVDTFLINAISTNNYYGYFWTVANMDMCVLRCLATNNTTHYNNFPLGGTINKTPIGPSSSDSGWDNISL